MRFSTNAAWVVATIALAGCDVHDDVVRARSTPTVPTRPQSPAVVNARSAVGLVPSADPKTTAALATGLKRAFDEARAARGPDLALVVGAAVSKWSNVADEAVRLACDERVVAIVAPPEPSLAHPAAQAATRCGVALVSTSAAPSVTAAGSRWVVSVAVDASTSLDALGYDAGRVIVDAVGRAGLNRDAVLAAARDGTPVAGAEGRFRFGRSGRRESLAN